MKSEYWFVRHTSNPMTASPATPATSSSHRTAAGTLRSALVPPTVPDLTPARRVGQIIATAAPISRPQARVSVPSYTRVGS